MYEAKISAAKQEYERLLVTKEQLEDKEASSEERPAIDFEDENNEDDLDSNKDSSQTDPPFRTTNHPRVDVCYRIALVLLQIDCWKDAAQLFHQVGQGCDSVSNQSS